MKTKLTRLLMACLAVLCFSRGMAQLPNGSTAPDFTATDINGNSINLYSYLNAGKPVIMDISATWCGPCWNYHQTHALKDLYNQYGPPGTNELMVIFVEGDNSTTLADLQGTGSNTLGNWVSGTPYPILDNATIANSYQIAYYPTIYLICPDKKTEVIGSLTTAQLYQKAKACPATLVNAEFSANLTTINVGQSVNFTDLSTGSPTSWSWSFQGGTPATSTAQNPGNITYNTAGTYQVSLTATNANGSDTETKTSYITVVAANSAPVADFSANSVSILTGGSVNFTDLSAGNPTSWSWSFQGGTPATSTAQNPNNIAYNTAGVYNVVLTATNASGSNTKTKTAYITVTDPVPCDAGATNTSYEYISNVNFGTINNTSTTQTGGYANYSSQSTTITAGQSQSITVTIANPYSSDQVLIWADWNRDTDFTDPGELLFTSATGNGPFTTNITVPVNTTAGNVKMRIRLHDTGNGPNATPCGTSTYGEVEDYTINVHVPVVLSNDATLSNLTSGGSTVTGFNATTYTYNVVLPYGTTTVPAVTAVPNHSGATYVINNAASLPGTTSIVVTAENGTTQLTYNINYSIAGRSLKLLYGAQNDVSDGTITVNGTSIQNDVASHVTIKNIGNQTITVKVSKTVITEFSGGTNAFCWVQCFLPSTMTSPNGISFSPGQTDSTNFSGHCYPNGNFGTTTVKYTFYDQNNTADMVTLTVNYVIAPHTDATLSNLTVDGSTVTNFNPQTLTYDVLVTGATVPAVGGTPNHAAASLNQTDATTVPGTTTIVVTAQDGVTQLTYQVNFDVTVGQKEVEDVIFACYPNPTSGTINLDGIKNYNELSLFDIGGKLVFSKNLNEINKLSLELDLPKGVYYLQLRNALDVKTVQIQLTK